MAEFDDQAAVDAAFADLDHLLERSEPPRGNTCVNCGSSDLERCSNVGQTVVFCMVCNMCGAEQPGGVEEQVSFVYINSSNYKRIHHWRERISQLLLCESAIPTDHFLQIAERLCDGSYTIINKDVIRTVLRSLKMQLYIEKWLQIIQRITGIEPPKPGASLVGKLDDMFQELQAPFRANKLGQRKNFLNYNYVFCRLFQKIGCPQFSMFFPLIKSRAKLRHLDEMWDPMVASIG